MNKSALTKRLMKVMSVAGRAQCKNPGWNIQYLVSNRKLYLVIDLNATHLFRLSKSKKTYVIACSIGPYDIPQLEQDDIFAIVNVCQRRKIHQVLSKDLANITTQTFGSLHSANQALKSKTKHIQDKLKARNPTPQN